MNPSLSVILPVHNAQEKLARQVSDILDILPDLSSQFQVLIVDDASTDATEEIAHELARTYPQVQLVRHTDHGGTSAAVQTGFDSTSADVIYIQNPESIGSVISGVDACRAKRV